MTTTTETTTTETDRAAWLERERAKQAAWFERNAALMKPAEKPAESSRPDALAGAEQAAKAALSRFEKAKAELFRPDGAPRYGEKEQAERMEALLEPVRAARADMLHTLDAANDEAGKLDVQAKGADPVDMLNADELTKAGALAVFVDPDVKQMRLEALADRLAAISLRGDRATKYAYLRSAGQRYDELTGASQRNQGSWAAGERGLLGASEAPRLSEDESKAVARIRVQLQALRDEFTDPAAVKAAERAKALRKRVNELRVWAFENFGNADGSNAAAQAAQFEFSRNLF